MEITFQELYQVFFINFEKINYKGRTITFIVCIWGVFVVSLMVVTLSNTLNMDNLETKALNIIMRLEKRKEVQ